MGKVRLIYKPDGSVTIRTPGRKEPNETEQEWLIRNFNVKRFRELPYDDIDSSELPQSREDRDAWTGEKGKGVSVDQVKAAKLRADKETEEKIQEKLREIAIKEIEKEEL